jgi:endonuclease/exonuclease/phosphatase family metal-dependent hydrolase
MPRISCYNCQQSHARTLQFITNTAAGSAAICTQESGTRMALNSYITSTPNFMCAEAYINDACAVVTQTNERVSQQSSILLHAGSNHNRAALLVQLRQTGLIVVNVHLTSGNIGRSRDELRQVYQHIQTHHAAAPWIIIGDFNHVPTGAGYPGVLFAQGPQHSSGNYLDWAMAGNVANLQAGNHPRYHGSDHGPWFVDVN